MGWWSRLLGLLKRTRPSPAPEPESAFDVPLPVLVHIHPKEKPPPGPLEPGFVELEQDDLIIHCIAGVIQPDGTICDLPDDKLDWARRLSYRHLKREGCLDEFGIPLIAAYEGDDPVAPPEDPP